MIRQHHRLCGYEFDQTLGDSGGQRSLASCSPQGHKELDLTQRLNNNNNPEAQCFNTPDINEVSEPHQGHCLGRTRLCVHQQNPSLWLFRLFFLSFSPTPAQFPMCSCMFPHLPVCLLSFWFLLFRFFKPGPFSKSFFRYFYFFTLQYCIGFAIH